MAPRQAADEDREAVYQSIETVAANLTEQVAELKRFVSQLRPHSEMNPVALFPPSRNGTHGKEASG